MGQLQQQLPVLFFEERPADFLAELARKDCNAGHDIYEIRAIHREFAYSLSWWRAV